MQHVTKKKLCVVRNVLGAIIQTQVIDREDKCRSYNNIKHFIWKTKSIRKITHRST